MLVRTMTLPGSMRQVLMCNSILIGSWHSQVMLLKSRMVPPPSSLFDAAWPSSSDFLFSASLSLLLMLVSHPESWVLDPLLPSPEVSDILPRVYFTMCHPFRISTDFSYPKTISALENAGIQLSDVDFFEINEAFASQAVYSIKKLGIDFEKVNPVGGAIALGM